MDGKAEGYDFERKPNPVPVNKQLLIIPGASHCDLYDGGGKGMIPWDNIEEFLKKNSLIPQHFDLTLFIST